MQPCEIIARHATEAGKSNGSGTGVAREWNSGFHVLPVNCHATILAVNILLLGLKATSNKLPFKCWPGFTKGKQLTINSY